MEIKDMHRMDYACNHNQYAGLSSDMPNGISDLPTEGVMDCSTFFVIDTSQTYMFYKGTWYELQ